MAISLEHRFAHVNGVRLHFVEAGDGPLVVLLHGFPEFWYSWRHQLPALAQAGFRALAPDLRGYNESDRPAGVDSYRIDRLADDIVALIRHVGAEKAHIVGHDWGGGIAWRLASQRREVVDRLAVLNCPHPAAFVRELCRPSQLLRSWYMFYFQIPWLPEWLLRRNDHAGIARAFAEAKPGAFTPEDIEQYKQALARPGALTAAINYYRAAFRNFRLTTQPTPELTMPTLLIWGMRDRYLGPRLTEGLEEWVPGIRIERIDATHWVQCDEPEQVNRLLVEFLQAAGSGVNRVEHDEGDGAEEQHRQPGGEGR